MGAQEYTSQIRLVMLTLEFLDCWTPTLLLHACSIICVKQENLDVYTQFQYYCPFYAENWGHDAYYPAAWPMLPDAAIVNKLFSFIWCRYSTNLSFRLTGCAEGEEVTWIERMIVQNHLSLLLSKVFGIEPRRKWLAWLQSVYKACYGPLKMTVLS